MPSELHERAQLLADKSLVERLSPEEQRWLEGHLQACDECSRYVELSRRTVRALDCFAFDLDPVAAQRVQDAVRAQALRQATGGSHRRSVWGLVAVAVFLTAAGSLGMWQGAAWAARRWSLPSPEWQIALGIFGLLPSILVGILPFFRRTLTGDRTGNEGGTL